MGKRLAVEAQDATMREGLASHHTGIVDEELHGEIVGTIDDEVVVLDDIKCVRRVEEFVIRLHLHVRIDGLDLLLGTLHLRHAYVLREVDHLALEVAQIDR